MGLSRTRANSSFISSELESSLLSDENRDEEETLQQTLFGRMISIGPVRKALEYILDTSLEQVRPRRVVRIYRLLGLKSTTPQELFAVKVAYRVPDRLESLKYRMHQGRGREQYVVLRDRSRLARHRNNANFPQINNGEYLEALQLADRFELDSDPVYQHQWRKTEPKKGNINSLLDKVKNKSWVLQECLTKRANDVSI